MTQLKIGDKVTAVYKTGQYIGEITEDRGKNYLVRILSVLRHPLQGDIHQGKDADVSFFHVRRALAFREQANIQKNLVKPYPGVIPDYKESLRTAVDKMKNELVKTASPWAEASLKNIETLEEDYFNSLNHEG